MNRIKKLLTKDYKYESLYILGISLINIYLLSILLKDNNINNLSLLKKLPEIIIYILIGLLVATSIMGIVIYIITIICKKKITNIYKKVIRIISYCLTIIIIYNIIDVIFLSFISRYLTITKPTNESSTLDTIIFFMKEFKESFISGIFVTIKLSLFGTLIGLIIAFIMVILRNLEVSKRDNDGIKLLKTIGITISKIYITVIRGTPMIVQAFVFYYLVLGIFKGSLDPNSYTNFVNYGWTPFRAGLFTVSVNTGAYLTEVLRGGISSVDKGQQEATKALGMNKVKAMIYVIFPQAIKNALPSIGNEFIINIKDTSVLAMIGVLDLFRVGGTILGSNGYSGKSLEAYILLAIYYLILTLVISRILKIIEVKFNMPVKELTSSN